MTDILLKHGQVLTMDNSRRIIRDGAVAVEEGRIVAVGKTKEVEREFSGAEFELDAKGNGIMPGLVDTHTHLNQTLGKGFGDDLELATWLEKALGVLMEGVTKENYFHGARLGCLEAIKSGTTSLLAFEQCNILPGIGEDLIKVLSESGVRAVLGWGLQDIGDLDLDLSFPTMQENLTNLTTAVRRWDGSSGGRIRVWPAPITGLICTAELMLQAKDLANKHGLGVTIHLDETPEVDFWRKSYPKIVAFDGVGYYDRIVGLQPNVLSVHCCWTTNKGIARMAVKGANVSHNTISNMYLASGIANVPRMLKEGVNVALGVDGATSNNNQDMFEVMKTTALLHKVHNLDPQSITAEQVLEMATIHGAKALLMEEEIGSLELGKKADLIVVDLKKPNTSPNFYLPSTLVYCANGSNVDTVIIDGKIVMKNRVVETIDEEKAIRDAQRSMDELLERKTAEAITKRSWPVVEATT